MNNLLGSSGFLNYLWLLILGVILIALIVLIVIFVPVKLWFKALISGARISMVKLASLKSMKLDVDLIVKTYINARKAGIYIDVDELQTHMTAGGNIESLVNAIIMADSFKLAVSIDTLKAIDLSGKNVVEAVKTSTNPKTIETEKISCVTRDGIEVKVRFKIDIKANLKKMVGALGEENIVSRVGENAVSVIGGYKNYSEVVENVEDISNMLLSKDLDEGNAFKIVSIEMCNVEIGSDFGAKARASRIEEERLRANMQAEQQRNEVALEEQRMKVKVQQMNVEKVKAEMDLPKALAKSVTDGKINIMDYYKMQNIIADTDMRKALAKSANDDNKSGIYMDDEDDDE